MSFNEDIAFYAFRYCLGRRTYCVTDCVEYLIANWPNISRQTQLVIHDEVGRAYNADQAGDQQDKDQWMRVFLLPIKESRKDGP